MVSSLKQLLLLVLLRSFKSFFALRLAGLKLKGGGQYLQLHLTVTYVFCLPVAQWESPFSAPKQCYDLLRFITCETLVVANTYVFGYLVVLAINNWSNFN